MATITLRSDFDCELVQSVGSDEMIARAAWVCSGNDAAPGGEPVTEKRIRGVLKALLSGRHGTPFEHAFMTFRLNAPIFIWREWHRHRIGFSYNEESGRYKQLAPVFYVPGGERAKHCIKPANFKPMKPGFRGFMLREWQVLAAAIGFAHDTVEWDNECLRRQYQEVYDEYSRRINDVQYDNGLARIGLPVGLYSSCYVSCNPRSLMAFMELRTDNVQAMRRSAPLWELHTLVEKQVEPIFSKLFPITYEIWNECGRMAP